MISRKEETFEKALDILEESTRREERAQAVALCGTLAGSLADRTVRRLDIEVFSYTFTVLSM